MPDPLNADDPSPTDLSDAEIQQDIRRGRPFSLAEAIGQEAGGFMKGESPVPKLVQAQGEAIQILKANLEDLEGALQQVLIRWLEDDTIRLSRHVDEPIEAVKDLLRAVLASPETLYNLVHQTDVLWGRLYDERPHFQKPGQTPHPDDEYTHESVRAALMACLQRLETVEDAPPEA
ncbi:hypothetical protein GFS31_23050 [Leptolyngbya sp. BL0902]|uniref:hypothetical protein n=1 Tax=Leptolyngbya sp. BL0902 TaxID=1115757 RepID=UPI001935594D|nr:hypothetical protein [Leptolyngbya sp. BL0902]QQE65617.1 hypothetical protein GFS31_23050 [Leptolyngbya sp. BL0902]